MANVAPYTLTATPVYIGTVQAGGSITIQNTGPTNAAFAGSVKAGQASNLTSSNGLEIATGASIQETNAADAHDWYALSPSGTTIAVAQ